MHTGEFKVTFQGGNKFKGVLAKISAQAVGVRAGILEGATKPDGTPIPPYAAVNEFGGKSVHNGKIVTIPARPFMRDTVRLHSAEWGKALAGPLAQHPDGAKAAMYIVGQNMTADIKATIAAGNFTPLSEVTIAKKRTAGKAQPETPLINTGSMLQAVSYEVVDGGAADGGR